MPDENFHALMKALTIKTYTNGEIIVKQNNPGNTFYIVKEGFVDVFRDGVKIRTISRHDYFGERSVLFNNFRSATALARGNVVCWELSQANFQALIDESVRQQLMNRVNLQDDTAQLENLEVIRSIGEGMFGNVFLVRNTLNGN